ncbi:hypothetical protein ACJJTC_011354 [Scirpophaga incertulas]
MDLASQMNNNLQHMMSIFTSRMSEFEKILAEQVSGSSGTPQTVKALAAEYTGFKSFILDAITILKKEIELLVHGYDHLESQSRRKVLLFHGLPEKKDEVLQDRIVTLINDQMKIADFNDNAKNPLDCVECQNEVERHQGICQGVFNETKTRSFHGRSKTFRNNKMLVCRWYHSHTSP